MLPAALCPPPLHILRGSKFITHILSAGDCMWLYLSSIQKLEWTKWFLAESWMKHKSSIHTHPPNISAHLHPRYIGGCIMPIICGGLPILNALFHERQTLHRGMRFSETPSLCLIMPPMCGIPIPGIFMLFIILGKWSAKLYNPQKVSHQGHVAFLQHVSTTICQTLWFLWNPCVGCTFYCICII